MARILINFLGARRLKDGTMTGMCEIPANADRHALVDLEGECWLTNETTDRDYHAESILKDCCDAAGRIVEKLNEIGAHHVNKNNISVQSGDAAVKGSCGSGECQAECHCDDGANKKTGGEAC